VEWYSGLWLWFQRLLQIFAFFVLYIVLTIAVMNHGYRRWKNSPEGRAQLAQEARDLEDIYAEGAKRKRDS
jgi:hypothetical protein